MKVIFEQVSLSVEDTANIALKLPEFIGAEEDFISITGTLGAGKTTFAKSLISYFSKKTGASPTFSLINVYEGDKKIYHIDFYRLGDREELFEIGYYDLLAEPDSLKIVEWGNLYPEVLPKKFINVDIGYRESGERLIRFLKYE